MEVRGSCLLPRSAFTSAWGLLPCFHVLQRGCCYGVLVEEEMRCAVLSQAVCLEHPFWDAGFAEHGRLASGQGASILAGKSTGGDGGGVRGERREGGEGMAGISLPVLSPDVISAPWGGSAAKRRALLALKAPGLLPGALLVIWAVAGDRVCPGSPQAGGSWSLCFWDTAREKEEEWGQGYLAGLLALCPHLAPLGRGQRTVMMPNVLLASPAEQVGLGQGNLCWADVCGCSSIS